jgi:DNA-binding MarR family transcriptional regulator
MTTLARRKPRGGTPAAGSRPRAEFQPGSPHWSGLRLVGVVNRCMQPLYAELERREGLLSDEAAIIVCLSITTAVTAQQVARYTGRPKNSISRAVAALEGRGLIGRSPHPEDGRAVRLELTQSGVKMFEDIRADYAAADERLLETLGEEERRVFVELVTRIADASIDWD